MALRKGGALYHFAWQTSVFAAVGVLFLALLISPSASALSGVNYKTQAIGDDWSTYDTSPSAGYSVESFGGRDDTLKMGVNSSAAATGRLEGLQRATSSSSEVIRLSLYIDGAWQGSDVRAGFGVNGKDNESAITTTVRIEFVHLSDFTGWRIGNDVVGWENLATGYNNDSWNEIEFAINKESGKINAFINGSVVDYMGAQFADYFSDVIISNYNFGSVGQDYSSYWNKLEVGRYDTTSPTISFIAPTTDDEVMKGSEYVSVFASDEIMLRQVGVKLYDAGGEVVRENAPLMAGTGCRLDISLAGLEDGWYRIDAYAVDGASNESQVLSRPFAIDSSVPQLAITSPFDSVVSGVTTVEGTMSDAHLHQYYSVVKNAEGVVVAGPEQITGDVISGWQWNTTTQPDGIYTLVLAAEDVVGNHNEITKEVRVDNTAPIVTLDAFNVNLAAGELAVFSGDINDADAQLTLIVDGKEYPIEEVQNGRWHHSLVNGLTAGSHTVSVVATDEKGNSSTLSTREMFVTTAIGVGTGSGVLPVKPFIDTAQLFKMAAVPEPAHSMADSRGEADVLDLQSAHVSSANEIESPSVALEPTENGWKLLGILWYWWVLCLLTVTGAGWYVVTKWLRRVRVGVLTD